MAKKSLKRKKAPKSAASQSRRKKSAKVSSSKTKPKKKATVRKKTVKKPAAAKKTSSKKKKKTAQRKASSSGSPKTSEALIRKLDQEILKLINRRADATTRLFQAKDDPLKDLFQPRADDDLWRALEDANPGPLPAHAVRGVFREILSAAKSQIKTARVAYLGPAFSFTHLAAIERFGEWADLYPVSTIASVFEEVNRGHANYGLVPIENSTDGRVIDTLDMFQRLPLRICGEVQISVHHNLLARCPRSEITEIYSKPQALSQCRDWLARNMPQARLYPVTSTSTAAELARTKPGVGAIASRQAAVEYDLQIIADDIEDNARNVTRFAVIGDEVSKPTGRDRTAVLLQIPHKPGELCDALAIFKKNKINLTWIESFPLRGPESGYLFFLDFEGHVNNPHVQRALASLQRAAVRLDVLGSYPRSEPRN
ncbi:MAG: prephenate dehydratase [Planctomycetaceae bacterium]